MNSRSAFKKWLPRVAGIFGILALLFVVLCVYFVWSTTAQWGPVIESRILEQRSLSSVRILAKNSEGNEQWVGSLSGGRLEERLPLKLEQIPPLLTQAIVTLEDPRFLEHGGFDAMGIARAMWANIKALRYAQGGSTITQQLVKNVFLSNEKTIERKLVEFVLATMVESNFEKDAILETYLNEIYYGQLGPFEVHGVGRAAEYYFSKSIDELELHEMALLAALAKGPGYYDPWRHPERTKNRRDFVLFKLADRSLILQSEYAEAIEKPLPERQNRMAPTRAPYLMDALKQTLLSEKGEDALVSETFDYVLDLDLELQKKAEEALKNRADKWDANTQGLFVAADPRSCTIKAYVGGSSYRISQLDHIRQIKRPVGSLMKPLLAQALLRPRNGFHLASVLTDKALVWDFDKGRSTWSPQNYDKKYRGEVSLRETLESSYNVPFVRIFHEKEPNGMMWAALDPVRALGFEIPVERAFPSALLGSIEQSPWRVLEAYLRVTRMALGLAHDAADFDCQLSFEKAADLPEPSAALGGERIGEVNIGARLAIASLEGAVRRGTSASWGRGLPTEQQWAGKTGTSSDLRDAWYVALSPELVALSWVGNSDFSETGFTGASGALPIVKESLADWVRNSEAWTWPAVEPLEWHWIEERRHCLARNFTGLSQEILDEQATTPPPAPVSISERVYYPELFHPDSLPSECEDLE